MTHIPIPRTPTLDLLRPFFECPTSELDQAWAAMVRIAEVHHARAGRQCLQQIEEGPQSVDIAINHGTEDLAMHSLSTAPAAVAGPAWDKTRDSLATLLLGLARHPFLNFDVACIALDAATERGMPLAYMRAAPAAPALEAPAAPAPTIGPKLARIMGYREHYRTWGRQLSDATELVESHPSHWRIVAEAMDELADALAAAPQVPVGLPWRTGIPAWTDDRAVRVIAVTAHDDFGGVQVHDIRASDFHTDGDGDGAEVARVCTHWAYRDDIWPRADAVAPAARLGRHAGESSIRGGSTCCACSGWRPAGPA
jgi:hypothetical protein